MSEDDLRAELHRLAGIEGTQDGLAKRLGIGAAYLSDVMRGKKAAGPSIYRALGLERVVTYIKIREVPRG